VLSVVVRVPEQVGPHAPFDPIVSPAAVMELLKQHRHLAWVQAGKVLGEPLVGEAPRHVEYWRRAGEPRLLGLRSRFSVGSLSYCSQMRLSCLFLSVQTRLLRLLFLALAASTAGYVKVGDSSAAMRRESSS
jgi:hypothetical protein